MKRQTDRERERERERERDCVWAGVCGLRVGGACVLCVRVCVGEDVCAIYLTRRSDRNLATTLDRGAGPRPLVPCLAFWDPRRACASGACVRVACVRMCCACVFGLCDIVGDKRWASLSTGGLVPSALRLQSIAQ